MITPQDKARAEAEKQGRYEFRCWRDCEDNPIDMTMGAFCESRAQAFADGAMWSCGHSPDIVESLMEFLEDYIEEGIDQIHDNSSEHGWQYDRGHPNWNATMNDLRTRLTELFKP